MGHKMIFVVYSICLNDIICIYMYIYIYTINGLIHFPHTSNLRMSTFQNLNAQRYEPPSQTQRGQLPGLEETVSVLVK